MIGEILEFPIHGDKDGSLVALEKGADFPFEIKRVYYIWGTTPTFVRGASCAQEPRAGGGLHVRLVRLHPR